MPWHSGIRDLWHLCGHGFIFWAGYLPDVPCDTIMVELKLFLIIINLVPVRKSTNWSRLTTTALLVKRQQPWFSLYWTPPQLSMFNWDKDLVCVACSIVVSWYQHLKALRQDCSAWYYYLKALRQCYHYYPVYVCSVPSGYCCCEL